MNKLHWAIILAGVLSSVILYPIFSIETKSEPIKISISEANVYDPLCKGEQNFSIDYSFLCEPHTQWSVSLGMSTNIDDHGSNYDRHLRTLFLNIPLSELPKDDFFQKINVKTAEIILRTDFDLSNKQEIDTKFAVLNSYCNNSNWNKNTLMLNLPCISTNKQIEWEEVNFSEYKKNSELRTVSIDIVEHANTALDNNLTIFTELVQFYPEQFRKTDFTVEQRKCLYDEVKTMNDMTDCIGENLIATYGVEHPAEGLRPQVSMLYTIQPTLLKKIISSIVSVLPALSSVMVAFFLEKKSQTRDNLIQTKISEQSKNINETKEIVQKQLEHYDERYKQRLRSMLVYLTSVITSLNDLILQGEVDIQLSIHMENQVDWIEENAKDLEFVLSELSVGVLPKELITKGLEICNISKKITQKNQKQVKILNLQNCKELRSKVYELLKIIPEGKKLF